MPLYHGDFLRDTMHLSTEERGAYLLLMMHYWQHGKIKNDQKTLKIITQISAKKLEKVLQFFEQKDGYFMHSRMEKEKAKSTKLKEERTDKAKKAAEARWKNNDAPSMPQAMPEQCPPQPQSQLDDDNSVRGKFYDRVQEAVGEGMILTNFALVDDWLAKGLGEDAILRTIKAVMEKKKKSPDPRPPSTLKYFHNAMAVTFAAMTEPQPEFSNVPENRRNTAGSRPRTKSERADDALRQWLEGQGLAAGTA